MLMRKIVLFFICLQVFIFIWPADAQTFYANSINYVPLQNQTLMLDLSNCNTPLINTCPPTNNVVQAFEAQYTDIALDINGNFYYVSGWGSLYTRNINNPSSCQFLASFGVTINALVADISGVIYAAGNNGGVCSLYKYDPATGVFSTIGNFPPNYFSAGDLFFYEGRLFLTCTNSNFTQAYLIEVNIADPMKSCYYMGLQNLQAYGAFSINYPSYSKAYIISTTFISNNNYQAFLYEIDMASRTVGAAICTYPYAINGAASVYHYTPATTTPASISIASSAGNSGICAGDQVTFTSNALNAAAPPYYQWTKNGLNVGANAPSYTDNTLSNGDKIQCFLAAAYSCAAPASAVSNTIVMNVTPSVTPSVIITANIPAVCEGNPVQFKATTTNGGTLPAYHWKKNGMAVGSNMDTYTDRSILKGDIITCEFTSNVSCALPATSNSIVMDMNKNPVVVLDHTPALCRGGDRQLDAGDFIAYLWNDGSAGRYLGINAPGTYYVTVKDNNGCQGSDTAKITTTVSPPAGFLPGDTAICAYNSLQLYPLHNYISYHWSTGSGSPLITVDKAGLYWLEVTDNNNCIGADSIIVSNKKCLEGFYVPTAFTPNKDGKNDLFKPLLLGRVKKCDFRIFNRWGMLVFKTTDITRGWDGNLAESSQNSNIFVWVCTYEVEAGPVETKTGTVVLIR